MAEQQKEDFKYDIVKALGVISVSKTGWTREANVISWNGRPAKLDIRDWAPEHARMSRGITLNGEESIKLMEILNSSVVKHENDSEDKHKDQGTEQVKEAENVSETASECEEASETGTEQERDKQAEAEPVSEENSDEHSDIYSQSDEASQTHHRPLLRMPIAVAAQG